MATISSSNCHYSLEQFFWPTALSLSRPNGQAYGTNLSNVCLSIRRLSVICHGCIVAKRRS